MITARYVWDVETVEPDDRNAAVVGVGTRLITMGTDGREGYDLGLTKAWLQFRDEQNA